jgi:pSer/pThr/pTyr-binding forkhead associated (FHA) protein
VLARAGRDDSFEYSFDRDEIVLGRAPSCDIVLPSPAVSARHAVISRQAGTFSLRDGGSTNGTRVNGEAVTGASACPLAAGARIEIGEFTLVFHVQAASRPSTTHEGTASIARRMVRDVLGVLGEARETPLVRVLDGAARGREVRIPEGARPVLIGRDASCDLQLDDKDTSREHARLRHDWNGVTIEDLGAKNPTLVGGQPLSGARPLRDGDELLIGAVRLVFIDPAERYLADLAERPDQPSAQHRPMVRPGRARAGRSLQLALYAIGGLLLAGVAVGLWVLLR